MLSPRLRALVLVFLWGELLEDTLLVVMAWLAPDLWFRVFHGSTPVGLEVAARRARCGSVELTRSGAPRPGRGASPPFRLFRGLSLLA